jgi:tetratricopeptide (TPR) repeat protein
VKKPQWITLGAAIFLVAVIYFFGRTTPYKKPVPATVVSGAKSISTDTILSMAKRQLAPEQVIRLTALENSISRGDVKDQQLKIYHQLAHFWSDSAGFFLPYAWYEAEAARLENSEKNLTFAARLFLDNLQQEQNPDFKRWEALQAKDLFERSLKINPDNDSAKAGLGACYLFGNISDNPMQGIAMIREVIEKDSTNAFAQMILAKASLLSGQYDKAITRLQAIIRLQPANLEAILILADVYERTNDKTNAIEWYQQSLQYITRQDAKTEIEKRIEELKK